MAQSEWLVEINELGKGREAFNAVLFSLSNGYVGTRGTDEETYAGAPRTFIAGFFNPDPLGMETMASVQNWLATRLFVEDSQFFYDVGKLIKYSKILDMKRSSLTKIVETENREGRITRIESVRFVSMDNPHLRRKKTDKKGKKHFSARTITPRHQSLLLTVRENISIISPRTYSGRTE